MTIIEKLHLNYQKEGLMSYFPTALPFYCSAYSPYLRITTPKNHNKYTCTG